MLTGEFISVRRKAGFPAVPELGWDYIPEGTILKGKERGVRTQRCASVVVFGTP